MILSFKIWKGICMIVLVFKVVGFLFVFEVLFLKLGVVFIIFKVIICGIFIEIVLLLCNKICICMLFSIYLEALFI